MKSGMRSAECGRRRLTVALIVLLGIAAVGTRSASAQGDAMPQLSPADSEAYDITQNLQFGCKPQRWAKSEGSESRIENRPQPLTGRASLVLENDEIFLVLEQYNEDGSLFCAVLTRRGVRPPAGRYAVGRVSAGLFEQTEPMANEPFYGMFAFRDATHASLLVVDSGFVELTTSESGKVTGSFELAGFAIDGAQRTAGVVRRGSFTAVTPPE